MPVVCRKCAGRSDGKCAGCGRCPACSVGAEHLCEGTRDGRGAGLGCDGGLAEYVVVPAPRLTVPLDGLDPASCAEALLAMGVSAAAGDAVLKRRRARAGAYPKASCEATGSLTAFAIAELLKPEPQAQSFFFPEQLPCPIGYI